MTIEGNGDSSGGPETHVCLGSRKIRNSERGRSKSRVVRDTDLRRNRELVFTHLHVVDQKNLKRLQQVRDEIAKSTMCGIDENRRRSRMCGDDLETRRSL